MAYRGEFLIWILSTNMPLVMLLLWSAVAEEAPVGRFGVREFSAYFLATLVVRLLTGAWVVWQLNYEIRHGALAMRLLRPLHPFVSYAAEHLAALPIRVLLALPIAGAALLWLGRDQLASDPLHWVVFPLSLAGAWALTFGVMLVIGTLGFFWESSLSLFDLWLGLFFVFSGYTIPLELFPASLLALSKWLPFRYVLSFPVETLLGLLGRRELLLALASQWTYVAIVYAAALLLWRAGLRRFAAYGG
ncbi:MAG: ABC-2 family transporter protein [Deltaproteobacteria bacterium]|nr:ABC-2 family transporter protein [Deltaproteobacteria bacterium]